MHTWNLKGAEDVNVEMGGMRYTKWVHPILSDLVDELKLNHAIFTEGNFPSDGVCETERRNIDNASKYWLELAGFGKCNWFLKTLFS